MRFIEKTFPYHTQSQMERDVALDIRFFLDIHADTLNPDTIILLDMIEQKPVDCSHVYKRRSLQIKPMELLKPKHHYQLLLKGGTNGIKDVIGIEMADSFELEFFTKEMESIKPPAIIKPVNRTIIESPFDVKLSPVNNAMYYEVQLSKSNRFDVILWPQNSHLIAHSSVIEFRPDISLVSGNYYLRARSVSDSGETSEYGPVLQVYIEASEVVAPITPMVTLSGNTLIKQEVDLVRNLLIEEVVDTVPTFFIIGTSPRKDETHIPIEKMKKIIVRFSENIDPKSVSEESVYVIKERN